MDPDAAKSSFLSFFSWKFSSQLFPPACLLCQSRGHADLDICEGCLSSLASIEVACQQCALPLAAGTQASVCGKCLQQRPYYDESISLFEYRDAVVSLITQLKFNGRLPVARTLGELLYRKVDASDMDVDAILPVPLHVSRIRHRGFNQSIELAKTCSQRLNIPLMLDAVERVRATSQQTGLDARQRRKNIKGAFAVIAPLALRHVAIVDDVVTTGSTVNELSRILKNSGVEKVSVWSAARAPLK